MSQPKAKTGPILLGKEQIERAAEALARAFHNDPEVVRFLKPEKRPKLLRPMFRMELYHAVEHGEVYAVSPTIEGVAIWMPSSAPEISLGTLLRSGGLGLLLKTRWDFLLNLGTFWGFMRRMMRDEEFAKGLRQKLAPFPHWYLAVLGVDPDFQGRGGASRLLKPMLSRLDKEGLPAYLETTTEGYVPLYQHFGFRVIREEMLPGTETKMWVMMRGEGK